MKIFVAYLLLVIVAFHKGSATNFTVCEDVKPSPTGKVTSVEIEGCPNNIECKLKVNSNIPVSITFAPSTDEKTVTAEAKDVSFFSGGPFVVDNPDVCDSGIQCPLKSGQSYTYNGTVAIPATKRASFALEFRMELKDASKKDIICISVDARYN